MEEAHSTPSKPALSLWIAIAFIFLLPIFFLPLSFAPFQFSKTLLALVVSALLFGFFFWRSYTNRRVTLSVSPVLFALWLVPAAYFVASLFSSAPHASWFGYELSPDTFGFVLVAAALATTLAFTLQTQGRVFTALMALFAAGWVVFLVQAFQLAFSAPLPWLPEVTANLVGRWSDFGMFTGLIASLVLLTLESIPLPKIHRLFLWGTFIVSLGFMVLVNMDEVWYLFGTTSFAVLVFALSKRSFVSGASTKTSLQGVAAFVGLVVALFFITIGGGVATALQSSASINALDVRPSLQSTVTVLSLVYETSPLVGSGPNTFGTQWLKYRSADIVQSPFWNLSFNSGSNAFLSSAATGGLVVALAWLLLILALVYGIVRSFFTTDESDPQTSFLTSMTALGVLFLLGAHLIYAPSASITLLLFVFIALFIVTQGADRFSKTLSISLSSSPRASFIFVLVSLVAGLALVTGVYGASKAYASAVYHNRAVSLANAGDLSGGSQALTTALSLSKQDRYYRTAALINLAELRAVVSAGESGEEAQARFRAALTSAIANTGAALQRNRTSYENWMLRGVVYQSAVPLGINGSYENAVAVYEEARKLNPASPEIDLRIAEMHAARGEADAAKEAIASALGKKPDYTVAILLKAQIELDSGNIRPAIESIGNAIYFEPNNTVLWYQLGILLLQDEEYDDAASAFETALGTSPGFANARFFLSQSYAFLGRFEEAAGLMSALAKENPDNALVADYRQALASGDNPFRTAPTAPAEDAEAIE